MKTPQIATTIADAQAVVQHARQSGRQIGFVPTMGALHEGHMSLVHASQESCDYNAVSIFVNPTQFGEGEDLNRYPRTFDADLGKLTDRGVDLVFAPTSDQMYPSGYSTFVEPPEVASRLEGTFRPVHFRGVATVVLKLFNAVPADLAFFGEKDFQQCLVIQHMVRDLNLRTKVVPCPIIRESDGLAMSSRNRYLSADDRSRALSLAKALEAAANEFERGNRDAAAIESRMLDCLQADSVDYAVVVNANTLGPFAEHIIDAPAVALIAAHVGATRLIDNRRLNLLLHCEA